jgi:hypothetical protein
MFSVPAWHRPKDKPITMDRANLLMFMENNSEKGRIKTATNPVQPI